MSEGEQLSGQTEALNVGCIIEDREMAAKCQNVAKPFSSLANL